MKKRIVSIFWFLLLSIAATAQSTAEEKALWKAIDDESVAFHTSSDRKAFLAFWHITDQTRIVVSNNSGVIVMTNKEINAGVDAGQFPPPDLAVNEYSNVVVRTDGNIGWASFDQKSTTPDGKSNFLHEFRLMEKISGSWKIVASSIHLDNKAGK